MNTTVDTKMLGSAPLGSTLKIYGIIAAIPLLMMMTGSKSMIIFAFIAIFVLGLPFLFFFATKLGQSIRGNGDYKTAKHALETSTITPTLVGRGHSCMGIAMVDENNRRLYINGTVYSFDDVDSTEVGTFRGTLTYLDFMLRVGDNPNQRVVFDNEANAKNFQQRVLNALRAK